MPTGLTVSPMSCPAGSASAWRSPARWWVTARLLLADEPTGALDSVNAEAVMRLMLAICRRGVAGVVVTHDAQLASCADRVVFLRDGQHHRSDPAPPGPESLLTPGPQR